MKNVYTKPAYAHILLNEKLSSQCKKDESNQLVVNYSWQVCPIDTGIDPYGSGRNAVIFGDDPSCNMEWQSAEAFGICYLNAGPSTVVFGS